ncbi:50S ribosomal protein L13 [Candidatus Woesearchaeota archaeon]|nr:50S ribosomal protein L13 [Candidatus Woesearchaeota archaeon]
MIVNAEGAIAGKLAAFVAKQLLLGETVDIVNAEKAIITGNKSFLHDKFQHRRDRGDPHHGPYYPRNAHMILKRMIRGMLPWKNTRGREAYRRVRCHLGVPQELSGKEAVARQDVSKLQTRKFLTLYELAKLLGAK